jgi:cilia- and flagella-associated protein 52
MSYLELERILSHSSILSHFKEHLVTSSGGTLIIGDGLAYIQSPTQICCSASSSEMIAIGATLPDPDIHIFYQTEETDDKISFEKKYVLDSHDSDVLCLAFSVDGHYLFSVSKDRLIVNNLVKGGSSVSALPLSEHPVSIVSGGFVKDIKRRDTENYLFALLTVSNLYLIEFNVFSNEIVSTPIKNKLNRTFTCLCFTEDQRIIVGSTTGDIAVVKNKTIQSMTQIVKGGVVDILVVANDVVTAGGDGSVCLLNLENNQVMLNTRVELASEGRIYKVIELDGILYVSSASGAIHKIRFEQQESQAEVKGKHKLLSRGSCSKIDSIALPNSDFFFSVGQDILAWDLSEFGQKPVIRNINGFSVDCSEHFFIAAHAGAKISAFAFDDEFSRLWTLDNANRHETSKCRIAQNMRFFVAGGIDGELRIWDLRTKEMMFQLKEHMNVISGLFLLNQDQYALSTSKDRCMMTWDLRAEKRVTLHRERHSGITASALGRDQCAVLTASESKTLTWWDLRVADPVRIVQTQGIFAPSCLSLNTENTVIAIGAGHTVELFDFGTGKLIEQPANKIHHTSQITSVAFTPDSKQLISAAQDESIFVWNVY